MPLRVVEIDVRNVDRLDMLSQCGCGEQFIAQMRPRQECGECVHKRLYPPKGPSLWRRFMDWLDGAP